MAGAFSSGNNVQVGTQAGALSFSVNAIINLAADSLSGSIAAIRIHTEAMDAPDIEHKFTGGVMLGTSLFYNINAKPHIFPPSGLRQPSSLSEL